MIRSARGQRVELHYAPKRGRAICPHLTRGVAVLMGRGPGPRNVLVLLDDGRRVVVPGGNCMEILLYEYTGRNQQG